jgi:septum formation protein
VRLVLASASPRRRELLRSIGLEFEVRASAVEEVPRPGEEVHAYVTRLSREKAAEIAAGNRDAWVIGADTVVYIDDDLLEKPADKADAVRMLGRICGRTHTVFTGLTLMNQARGYSESTVTESAVTMLPLRREEIEWYVETGEPMDKAGAYAVQGVGAMFIERIDGSYTNVVGLPLSTLFLMMRRAGIDPLHAR